MFTIKDTWLGPSVSMAGIPTVYHLEETAKFEEQHFFAEAKMYGLVSARAQD